MPKCTRQAWLRGWNNSTIVPVSGSRLERFVPFAMIASAARPGEIRRVVIAAVLLGDDVFDMKRRVGVGVLWQPAILAALAGSLPDKISRLGIHASAGRAAQQAAGFGLQESDYIAFVDVFTIFRVLFRCKRTFVGLAAEFFNPPAELFSWPPVNNPLGDLRRETAVEGVEKLVE
jgi:hypothetical protein